MNYDDKSIYELLPAVHRIRDSEKGEPLKALIETIAEQAKITQDNIDELYDNWFIETCKEWVIPYIADLLGVRALNPIGDKAGISQRAYVANTISYRRRKGTAPVLEQLAQDIAGWRAHVVEFFELLQTTQYMNHIRCHRMVTPDLRRMDELDRINSAFDTVAHSVDVRHISNGRGKYNIPNIGIFVWRLQSYQLTGCDAVMDTCLAGSPSSSVKFFTFNPTGGNTQLFNRSKAEASITHISDEINVPGLLRRRALFDEIEARRQAITDGATVCYKFFDDRLVVEDDPTTRKHPVFEIFINDDKSPVPPEEILICKLEKCCIPVKEKKYKDAIKPITVAVDPVLGRFVFTDQNITKAVVSYSYGFSGDIGGGPYNRQETIAESFKKNDIWHVGVSKTIQPVGDEKIYTTVSEAINEWNKNLPGTYGVISIMDSSTYEENLVITIPEKSKLLLIAADWLIREYPETISHTRTKGDLSADRLKPYISGGINITGNGQPNLRDSCGEITINGLLIGGKISIMKGQLGKLNLIHSTIIPGKGILEVETGSTTEESNPWLFINIAKSICATISIPEIIAIELKIEDCIMDKSGDNQFSINASNSNIELIRTTVFGKTEIKSIKAENCIFNDIVTAKRRQIGCIRFSFVPEGSEAPRLFRCQPDLEIAQETDKEEKKHPLSQYEKESIKERIVSTMVPAFTSADYDHYGYAQLKRTCPFQINAGADDGSEMGAFSYLKQPQRQANLSITLDEYLPLGLEAGIIYVT